MDTPSSTTIEERLNRLEGEVRALQYNQEVLAGTVAALRERVGPAEPAPAGRPAGTQANQAVVFCWACRADNPVGALSCRTCGRPLAANPAAPVPAPAEERRPAAYGPAAAVARQRGGPRQPMQTQAQVRAASPKGQLKAVKRPAATESLPAAVVESVPAAPAPAFRPNFDLLGKSEFWLNKVGIGLLLLGLAFFFKYSIDKGWLNEPVRIGLGLALGTLLLGVGLRLRKARRHYSQVLLGGSIATYYITGFAAYELFHLVPYAGAFAFMALVTALAFALAVRQDEAILSLIGVAGGLLTPFVLTGPSTGIAGLITYTCVVLAGATALYFFRRWRALLWLSYTAGWAVFLLAWWGTVAAGQATLSDRWALVGAALFGLLAFWVVPVLGEVFAVRYPDRWPLPAPARTPELTRLIGVHVHILTVAAPLVTLGFLRLVWQGGVTLAEWGWWTLALAAVYGLAAWGLRRVVPALAYTHAMMAILLVTLGLVQILNGSVLIFSLAVEGTALLYVAYRLADRGTAVYGHLIWGTTGVWLLMRLMSDLLYPVLRNGRLGAPAPDSAPLTDLGILALLAASSFLLQMRELRTLYRYGLHFGVVLWLAGQLDAAPQGAGLIVLAWAAYAVALVVLHRRWPERFGQEDTLLPSHAIFAAAAGLFGLRLLNGQMGALVVFNVQTLIDAAFVAVVAGMSFFVQPPRVASVYRIVAHAGVLGLLWRELGALQNNMGYVLLAWAAYLVLVQYLCRRSNDTITATAAHVPLLAMIVWMGQRLIAPADGPWAILNLTALIDLAVIGLILGLSTLVPQREAALGYRIVAHLAFLAWFWRELAPLENGNAFITIAWGACGLALVVAGLWGRRDMPLVYAGIGTLLLVLVKLFLVDLAQVDPLWRVLLFLGFGGVFLWLSYFFQNTIGGKPGSSGRGSGGRLHWPGRPAH